MIDFGRSGLLFISMVLFQIVPRRRIVDSSLIYKGTSDFSIQNEFPGFLTPEVGLLDFVHGFAWFMSNIVILFSFVRTRTRTRSRLKVALILLLLFG